MNALVILDIFIVVSRIIFKCKVLAKQKVKNLLENIVSKDKHKTKKRQLLICHDFPVLAAAGAFPEKLRTQPNVISPPVFQKVEMQCGSSRCTKSNLPETTCKAN